MKLLLDTNIVIRWFDGRGISSRIAGLIADHNNTPFVSSISIFEIEMKKAIGKLQIPENYLRVLEEDAFSFLPLNAEHAFRAARLPLLHKDPFDRMMVAQAQTENATLITTDAAPGLYEVSILKA